MKYEASCRFFSKRSSVPKHPDGTLSIDHSSLMAEVDASAVHLPWYAPPLAGALAGVVSWIVTFPFDVVKTRIQSVELALVSQTHAANSLATQHPFRSTLSTIVYSYRSEGLVVFFRGLSPTLIR